MAGGGGGGGGGGGQKQDDLTPHPVKDQLPGVSYCITSPPPWREYPDSPLPPASFLRSSSPPSPVGFRFPGRDFGCPFAFFFFLPGEVHSRRRPAPRCLRFHPSLSGFWGSWPAPVVGEPSSIPLARSSLRRGDGELPAQICLPFSRRQSISDIPKIKSGSPFSFCFVPRPSSLLMRF
jgi:hypothetical protein